MGGARGEPPLLFLDENEARSLAILHILKHKDVIDIDCIMAEFARPKYTRLALSFGSKNKEGGGGEGCKLLQFVVYCVLFVGCF